MSRLLGPGRLGLVLDVGEQQLEEIVDAALHDLEPAVHVAFAEGQLRIEHEVPLEPLVGDLDDDRGAAAVAIAYAERRLHR